MTPPAKLAGCRGYRCDCTAYAEARPGTRNVAGTCQCGHAENTHTTEATA